MVQIQINISFTEEAGKKDFVNLNMDILANGQANDIELAIAEELREVLNEAIQETFGQIVDEIANEIAKQLSEESNGYCGNC